MADQTSALYERLAGAIAQRTAARDMMSSEIAQRELAAAVASVTTAIAAWMTAGKPKEGGPKVERAVWVIRAFSRVARELGVDAERGLKRYEREVIWGGKVGEGMW